MLYSITTDETVVPGVNVTNNQVPNWTVISALMFNYGTLSLGM